MYVAKELNAFLRSLADHYEKITPQYRKFVIFNDVTSLCRVFIGVYSDIVYRRFKVQTVNQFATDFINLIVPRKLCFDNKPKVFHSSVKSDGTSTHV
jgi:hypothetical protein